MSKALIEIDGSLGEGGGQILRTSLALSLITGKAFHLRKIRARRPKPGLQAQHLMSVQAAARIGAAHVRGASLQSVDLVFEPGTVTPGKHHFKIGTAGATGLVLQTIYLPLALAGGASTIAIEGGTHVKASPCFHFLDRTWSRYLRSLGITVELSLDRVGFYPRGGGLLRARIGPAARILPFHGLTNSGVEHAKVFTLLAGLPPSVGERMHKRASQRLVDLGLDVEAQQETLPGGPGCILGIELPTQPAPTFLFGLGERGKPAEAVADDAVRQVEAFLAAHPLGVDEHSSDQLLLPLALADGASEFRVSAISSHLLTNAAMISHFLDRTIKIEGSEGEPGIVRVS